MCGIAGIIKINQFIKGMPQYYKVDLLLSKISHRGPDDVNIITSNNFIVGANRLSIVDRKNGHQPVQINEGTEINVAFNGEVYNHLQLRDKYAFNALYRSYCDTETIAYLVSRIGIHAISEFNGMFSIFINIGSKSYLVRDRFGVKPLYYSVNENELTFSSELKSFLT